MAGKRSIEREDRGGDVWNILKYKFFVKYDVPTYTFVKSVCRQYVMGHVIRTSGVNI